MAFFVLFRQLSPHSTPFRWTDWTSPNSFLHASAALAAAVIVACGDDDEGLKLKVKNAVTSECKTSGPSASLVMRANGLFAEEETITLTALADGYVKLEHKNVVYGCDCDEVEYKVLVEDNLIIVVEDGGSGAANCTCTYDASCEIGQLDNGSYTLRLLNRDGAEIKTIPFTYAAGLNITVSVDAE